MTVRHWRFHVGRLLLAAAIVLVLGLLTGHALLFTTAGLVLYLGWHMANLGRLFHWLHTPGAAVPESFGIWSDIYNRIATLEKENGAQRDRYRAMIDEFRNLTNALPDATLVIDGNDCISWFNDAATRLLGLQSPRDLATPVTNLLRDPRFAVWLTIEDQLQAPLEMSSPRDENTWLTVAAIPFQQRQRLIVLRDTTDVRNVDQIRRDFVANISHELRTPLTVLQGYLELLQDHDSAEAGDAVARMQAQTAQMQSLLDDLLELSRLQDDETRGSEEVIDVPAMLLQLREQAEELSRGRHELEFDVGDGPWLSGIAADLESAFGNLLSNAIKYTPEGGRVTVRWRDDAAGPVLSVHDTGIGIPRRDLPRLTERFYRVGSDRARQTGGTGLGLAIVKHVLNAHQASLEIESELGTGSTFRCCFPGNRRRAREFL